MPRQGQDQVVSVLNASGIPDALKQKAYDAYTKTSDEKSFVSGVNSISGLPDSLKQQLHDLKFKQAKTSQPKIVTAPIKPTGGRIPPTTQPVSVGRGESTDPSAVVQAPLSAHKALPKNPIENLPGDILANLNPIAGVKATYEAGKDALTNPSYKWYNYLPDDYKQQYTSVMNAEDADQEVKLQQLIHDPKFMSAARGASIVAIKAAAANSPLVHPINFVKNIPVEQWAAMAISGAISEFAVRTLLPKAVNVLPKIRLTQEELEWMDKNAPDLGRSLTVGETAKPGVVSSLEPTASGMPAAVKTTTDIVRKRDPIIRASIENMVQGYSNGLQNGEETGRVLIRMSNIDKEAMEISANLPPISVADKLAQGVQDKDAINVGDDVINWLVASNKDGFKEVQNAMWGPLAQELENTGTKVKLQDTAQEAFNFWQDTAKFKINPLDRSTVKTALSKLIPFGDLDKTAAKLYPDVKNIKKLGFDALNSDQQAKVWEIVKSKIKPVGAKEAFAMGKSFTQDLNSLNNAGIKSYVLTKLNQALKNSMGEGFRVASPELAEQWEKASQLTFKNVNATKAAFVQRILDDGNPVESARFVQNVLGSPDKARTVVKLLNYYKSFETSSPEDSALFDYSSGTLEKGGADAKLALLKRYALKYLDDMANTRNSEKAYEELTSDFRGYKQLLGEKDYNKAVAEYRTQVDAARNEKSTTQASKDSDLYRQISRLAGYREPLEVIDNLNDPANRDFSTFVANKYGSNPTMRSRIGAAMYERIVDNSTNTGVFGAPGSLIDPVAWSKSVQDSLPQLAKFLTLEETQNLSMASSILRNATLSSASGINRIGAYRTLVAMATAVISMSHGATTGLASGAAMWFGPDMFMKFSRSSEFVKQLQAGIEANKSSIEFAKWQQQMTQSVNMAMQQYQKQQNLGSTNTNPR